MDNQRVLRVILPVDVIRKLDSAIEQAVGGYTTRNDVIRDAIEAYVAELLFGPPVPEMAASPPTLGTEALTTNQSSRLESVNLNLETPALSDQQALRLGNLDSTTIISGGIAITKDEPLFGLHNRDFPSLWAARIIADLTSKALVPAEDCLRKVIDRAWKFARQLAAFDAQSPMKLTALFPTNPEKRESSESAFRQFAIGTWWTSGETIHATGPLFSWQMCQLKTSGKAVVIGITEVGAKLLQSLSGLAVNVPHDEESARIFLAHLRDAAPADLRGFKTVLNAAKDQATRTKLQDAFNAWEMDWTKPQLASYSAAYVSRAREWGLLEIKQDLGRYILTEFGKRMLSDI